MSALRFRGAARFSLLMFLLLAFVSENYAQEQSQEPAQEETGQLRLRRSVRTEVYQGKEIEGEDRLVGPGDSLWRMLIIEKGLSEKRFRQYLVIVRGLNPHLKTPDILRVGETLFVPLRPDAALGLSPVVVKAEPTGRIPGDAEEAMTYRVKRKDHLFQILREQLGVLDDRELNRLYAMTKDLNPERKNWDLLREGEMLRLPLVGQASELALKSRPSEDGPRLGERTQPVEAKPDVAVRPVEVARIKPPLPVGLDHPRKLPARENLVMLGQVVEALGSEVQTTGQEVVSLSDGIVRLDKSSYPVIFSPKLKQKIIMDPDDTIPASLRSKLGEPGVATPVVPVRRGASLQEAVTQLLSRLGYQPLPTDRPVVVQEAGVGYEARGSWMALAPEEQNKAQEVYVISFTDKAGEIPEYLRRELSLKGMHLKDILLSASESLSSGGVDNEPANIPPPIKRWPRDKNEIVDEILLAYRIPFGVSETLAAELRDGIRVEARSDRIFETKGKRTALFFQRVEQEIKKVLQEKQGTKVVELDLASLSAKDIISRLLGELGEQVTYREHRFPAASGASKDRLTVTASGFLLASRSMFITDREIPQSLHRFFFERGLEIVYFQ